MSVTTEKVIVQVSVDGQVTLVSSVASSLGAASSAAVAQAAAAAALVSETNADTSEANAAASAAAALASEGNADTSEAAAAASAAAALVSKGNADVSEAAAAASAAAALVSEGNADVSEAAAAASAAAALVSEGNTNASEAAVAASAAAALTSANNADISEAAAAASAAAALASEGNADTSEANAAASAAAALASEGNADVSEAAAAASAAAALVSEGNADTSEANAAASAAAALVSQNAAAASEAAMAGAIGAHEAASGVHSIAGVTGLQTALNDRVLSSSIGASNGIAPLGVDSKIPSAYLPSYVDDVVEYANVAAFPVTGVTGIIYIALDTGRSWRWSGSAYTEIVASPGTTDDITEGVTNLFFLDSRAIAAIQGSDINLGSHTFAAGNTTITGTLSASGATRIGSGTVITSAGRDYLTIGGTQLGSIAFKNGSDAVVAYMQSGAANFDIFANTGGTLRLGANGTDGLTILSSTGLALAATSKLYLDGGGDTYLVETSANVLDMFVGGVNTLKSTTTLSTLSTALSTPDLSTAIVDKTVFPGVIVDTFIYDTAKDSDGGAWRHRCSHTSWENETLSGNWLGSAANEAAARAISGATTGSYYYDTTAAGFYTLNAGSGKTATYRGNVAKFPAKVLITVEAARVVLWDLTQAGAPMWMVFVPAGSSITDCGVLGLMGFPPSVAAREGTLVVGLTGEFCWLTAICFVADSATTWSNVEKYRFLGALSARNSAVGKSFISSTPIVDWHINDVAMTVLPGAPVDVATGLPIPTIAVATNGGVSVITDTGSVWDLTDSSNTNSVMVAFTDDGRIAYTIDDAGISRKLRVDAIPSADFAIGAGGLNVKGNSLEWYTIGAIPSDVQLIGSSSYTKVAVAGGALSVGSAEGLSVLHRNPATPTKGMVAYLTKDYNSGWQVGAIKGAWLADTVAETLTGAELVTNGTFTTDLSGWTLSASTPPTWNASGAIQFNSDGVTFSTAEQALTTITGKTYTLSLSMSSGSQIYVYVGSTSGATDMVNASVSVDGTHSFTFTASGTTSYLKLIDGAAASAQLVDNVSCRLADVDRSVKAKGLQVFGSLTKAAVASGSELVGYSGFSDVNYLEQPYNSDLAITTGCVLQWVNFATASAGYAGVVIGRSDTEYSSLQLEMNATGVFLLASSNGTAWDRAILAAVGAIPSTGWHLAVLVADGTAFSIYIDGRYVAWTTNTINTGLFGARGSPDILRIGKRPSGSAYSTGHNMALTRISATIPSAEQIKHIYETERQLFQANAACTLEGSSNAVTALAYDDETDLLHVGTSYGRSAFKGLVRVSSEATPVGAITALSAGNGVIVQGGATAVDVYVPAYTLREELLRDAEQMAKFGQNLIAHDFTATASQTTFTLPVGWEIVAVYQQGAIKRETTSWTRSFDGFKWSAVLGTGATVSDWISILAKRV